jgi:hypothetical protein
MPINMDEKSMYFSELILEAQRRGRLAHTGAEVAAE